MLITSIKIILVVGMVTFLACELDGFLFNSKKLDKYELPDNTIPMNLIHQVTLESGGNTIYGFWVDSNGGNLKDITVLYCHGNKHSIDEYWDRVMYLHQLGVRIFIFDYRGYGMSDGTSSEEGMHEDSEAALDYILARGVAAENLCLYGYSLGNVASIYLAAEKITPLCLIAESPFASANSLTQGSTVLDIPPLWLTQGKFDNAEKIKKINTPFFLMHGADDDFVRYKDNGKVVYENAPEPKLLKVIPGAGHKNIPDKMGIENYLTAVEQWIVQSQN